MVEQSYAWSEEPLEVQDPADLFDPQLAAIPRIPPVKGTTAPSASMPSLPLERPMPTQEEEDWDALMRTARLRAEAQAETEDEWDQLMREAHQRPSISKTNIPAPTEVDDDEEDWEQLMRKALSRESTDLAAAQVVQESVAANDDRGSTQLTSLPDLEDSDAEAAWLQKQSTKQTEQAEMQRKLKAMHEIRRLRGARKDMQRSLATETRPRLALGTIRPPMLTKGRRSPSPLSASRRLHKEDN